MLIALIFIACICILAIIYGILVIFKPNHPKPKVGDVLIERYKLANPFNDNTYQYETVKEIRKSTENFIYFLSYTSDIDGNETPNQSKTPEHTSGRLFNHNDWEIVKNIYS